MCSACYTMRCANVYCSFKNWHVVSLVCLTASELNISEKSTKTENQWNPKNSRRVHEVIPVGDVPAVCGGDRSVEQNVTRRSLAALGADQTIVETSHDAVVIDWLTGWHRHQRPVSTSRRRVCITFTATSFRLVVEFTVNQKIHGPDGPFALLPAISFGFLVLDTWSFDF